MDSATDPAVIAWQRVTRARRNDNEYLAAIAEFERAVPTTERGVILKSKLQRSRDRALADGDRLTWRGCVHRARFAKTIEEGLRRLTAGAEAGEGGDRGGQAGPAPTPGPGATRRRRKSVERSS